MKVKADKIASSTRHAKLQQELILSEDIIPTEGYILAVKVLNDKTVYNTVELVSGRMSQLCADDILAGVLGARHALRGYSGVVPDSVRVGDVINILNLGGVLGKCTGFNPDVGAPFDVEVLGAVLHFPSFTERIGNPASISEGMIALRDTIESRIPLVIISGTCMNAGKTRASCEIIRQVSARGKRVAAAKLTGISLMRDTLEMMDYGAERAVNFTDAGIISTNPSNVVSVAKGIVAELSKSQPDCIVLELGDGIMGEYGVMDLLLDADLMRNVKAHILAANDHVGAWGANEFLRGKCPPIDVICGPVTDNRAGVNFINSRLNLDAANAIKESKKLGDLVFARLFGETKKK